MNFVDAKISKSGNEVVATLGETNVIVPTDRAKVLEEKGYLDKTVIMGIRPEHIHDSKLATVEGS